MIGRCEHAAAFFLRRELAGTENDGSQMPEPYCLAMVLCDGCHRDAATGKFTILGTFSTFVAREFPAQAQLAVYFSVTDGLGPTVLRLRIVDAEFGIVNSGKEPGQVICQMEMEVSFEDPLVVMESAWGIKTDLPKPGLYHCELFAGDDLLMSRRMLAVQAQANEGESDE